MNIHECLAFGTSKCMSCSEGMQKYCQLKHEKIENGTFTLAGDYWDYIDLVINDDDDDDDF